MKTAYLDTSLLVAVAFSERTHARIARTMRDFDRLFSSDLLWAELASTLKREGFDETHTLKLTERITPVFPNRSLLPEINRILSTGYLKGADTWHLAVALYLSDLAGPVSFLTVDKKQLETARQLGMQAV